MDSRQVAILTGGNNNKSPVATLDFSSSVDPKLTFTRSSTATYFDQTNNMQTAASNIPRIDYGPTPANAGVTNWIRNSIMVGAAAGTPGTMPTNWFISVGTSGLTSSVVGVGTEDDISYLDVSFVGTSTAAGQCTVGTDNSTAIPATTGQTWTASRYLSLVGGSLANVTNITEVIAENTAAGSFVTGGSFALASPTGAPLSTQRQSNTRTLTGGATVGAIQGGGFTVNVPSGVAINLTLRIGAPQLEAGSVANSWVPTSGIRANQGGTVTNWIRNSTAQGGAPGVAPTFWASPGAIAGLTVTNLGPVIVDGIRLMQYSITGTAGATAGYNWQFDTSPVNNIPLAVGTTYTSSIFAQLVSGSFPRNTQMEIDEFTAASAFLGGSQPVFTITPVLTRFGGNRVVVNESAAFGRLLFQVAVVIGDVVNVVFNLGGPQSEQGAAMSNYVPTSGTAATSGASALGMLIEEARTNGIRNPRAEGAVIGAPGTAPTNWSAFQAPTGAAAAITGTGIENGIPYVDVTITGTSSSGQGQIIAEANNVIAAVNGQTWTHSMYARVIGTPTGLLGLALSISMRDGVGGLLGDITATGVALTTASLATQRLASTGTLANASTAFVMPRVFINTIVGALNFTIRVGGPQLELGTFATSLILPTAGSPAASTRAAEYATAPLVYPVTAGTIGVDALSTQLTPASDLYLLTTTGATQTLRSFFRNNGTEPAAALEGAATSTIDIGGSYIGVPIKHVVSFKQSQFISGVNSVTPATNTVTGTLAGTWATVAIGTDFVGGTAWNGWIKRLRYWNRALGVTEVQAATN